MRPDTRIARAAVVRLLRRVRGGRLELREGATRRSFGPRDAGLRAEVEVLDQRAYPWTLRGSTGWGEGYVERLWDCDELVALTRIAARSMPELDRWRRAAHPLLRPLQRLGGLVPRNTRPGARRNISSHYDLGNELFRAFLDERLVYSCALFPAADADLDAAQLAKLERICERLELGPGDHLLEIGTGWGALAIHAAATRGCRVTTTTISREQVAHARRRVREEGLDGLVTVLDRDYRDLGGRFSKLASIEMIEAVGWQYFPEFFAKCSSLLEPEGLMFLQAIVIGDDVYELEKASRSFSNKHIFPGGCLPSPGVIAGLVGERTDMREIWRADISDHYGLTLRLWRERFEAAWPRLAPLGYDERFRRTWRFYLATSEAGFREGRIRDLQLVFAKPGRRGGASSGGPAAAQRLGDERDAGPVDEMGVGGSIEHEGVGAGAG